ncbi:SGNH/GDSL hydrolase family protein [Chitinophaga defluvii]|uniref:SGNH/GDSL hydrolase family protein n=1 Tax=Chitinophaga defluvii TaxID=3163343 RepID=A0ABV2T211_9BACT
MQKLLFILLLVWSNTAMSQSALRLSSDTVKVAKAELVVQNSTKNIAGYLFNIDNGKTIFRKLGRSVQFKVGSPNFPNAGDSVYKNTDLANHTIKVWRNGLLQYQDNTDGVGVNTDSGKVVFRPALSANDRIYIEAFSGIDFSLNGASIDDGATKGVGKLGVTVFDNGDNTFTLRWATNAKTLYLKPNVYGLGASTLFGYGIDSPNKLGEKIFAWLSANTDEPSWTNLAVFGQTSRDLSQTADGGVVGHNIDTALNAHPDFIFVSLASNDAASDFTVEQSVAYYKKIDSLAKNQGIPIFWATTQPRSGLSAAKQTLLKRMADSIRTLWPDRYVEAFAKVVDSFATTDAVIKTEYGIGDGVHLNAAGVQFMANSLAERMQEYFKPIKGVRRYVIDTSNNQVNWAQFDEVFDQNTVKKTYIRPSKKELYFRVRPEYVNDTYADFSNIAKLKEYVIPPPPLIFDHRLLVDLGGDGVITLNGNNTTKDGKLTPSPDAQGKYWNNWIGDGTQAGFVSGAAINGLRTTVGNPTAIGMELIGLPQGTYGNAITKSMNFNGPTVGVEDYPMEALYDNMFLNTSINPNGIIVRLKGLSKTNTYYIKLWGARIDASARILEAKLGTEPWTASKRVDTRLLSGQSPNYNNAINLDGFTGVDSIDINMRVGAGSTFAHLSLMDIGIVGTLPIIPKVLLRDTTTTLSTMRLTGLVVTNGATVSEYEWKQLSGPNTAVIANPFDNATNISGLTNGTFRFKLTVGTTDGKFYSNEARVDVFPDNGGKKTLRVNFSKTAAMPIPGWFNVWGAVKDVFISATDPVTNWTVDNVNGSLTYWSPVGGNNASDTDGFSTDNNSGIIPDIALKSFWFNYSQRYVAGNENLQLSGLNPAKTYTLKLYASRTGDPEADVKYGCWRVNGGAELSQNAINNATNETVVTNVTPDANGKIRIAVVAPEGTSKGNTSFINALVLIEN